MTAYVITGNCNIDQLGTLSPSGSASARAGGDTVDTNGFNFTIDQDTRYGLTGGATLSLGSMTINAAKGGSIEIDARAVRVIPYNTGSGNVPAYNTTITQSGQSGSGKLIRVQSAINAAPTAPGAAMPASGFITVKQTTGTYASGALTGIGASATGADVAGWIELVGDESATINCNRLGTFRMRGDWYVVGQTSGSAATTWQLPTNGSVQYFPGVQVETGSGTGVYEWYPCAGSLSAVGSVATDEHRGKVCWITTAGVLRIGNDATRDVGYVPPSGRNIRIPNILTAVCTTAARGTNALPNATLATRYDFTTTGGGVIDIDKANLAWYPSISQAYSVSIVDTGILTQMTLNEVANPMTLTRVCVGQEAANTQAALIMTLCFAGGTITDCVWSRAALATATVIVSCTDCTGFTRSGDRLFCFLVKGNAGAVSYTLVRVKDSTFTNTKIVSAKVNVVGCVNVTFTSTRYADVITGTTATTAVQNNYCFEFATAPSTNVKVDGIDFYGLTNVHPYLGVMYINVAGCSNIKLRNIGTSPSAPLALGAANTSAYLIQFVNGSAASDVKVQRCFISNTRTNLFTMDNSCTRITFENIFGDLPENPVLNALNSIVRSVSGQPTYAAATGVYGTHWYDTFSGATTGRIAILMNEPTSATAAQVSLTGGAAFTAAQGLYMPTIGMTATFTMPYFAKGHTGFTTTALVMAGGTAGNYTYAYQIDTGSGFGAWSSELTAANLATSLNGLGAISPSTGFKLKLRITTGTTNTTAITSVYVTTSTTTSDQANYFPLDTINLTLTGLQSGSDVVVYQAGTTTVRSSADAVNSFVYTYETPESVDIGVFKAGYIPFYIRGYSLGSSDASVPVAQVVDRAYLV